MTWMPSWSEILLGPHDPHASNPLMTPAISESAPNSLAWHSRHHESGPRLSFQMSPGHSPQPTTHRRRPWLLHAAFWLYLTFDVLWVSELLCLQTCRVFCINSHSSSPLCTGTAFIHLYVSMSLRSLLWSHSLLAQAEWWPPSAFLSDPSVLLQF